MSTPAASSEQTRFSALLLEGLEHYRKGEMLEAVRSWEEAYRLEPTNLRAREFLRSALERIHAQLRASSSKPAAAGPGAVQPEAAAAASPLPTPPLGTPAASPRTQAPSAAPTWPPPRSALAAPPPASAGHPWLPQPGGARRPASPPGAKPPSLAAVAGAVLAADKGAKARPSSAPPTAAQRGSPSELAATSPRGLPPLEQTAPWDDGPSLALPSEEELPERSAGEGELGRTNRDGATTRVSGEGPLGRTTPEGPPGRSGDSGVWSIHESEKSPAMRGAPAKARAQTNGALPSTPPTLPSFTDRPKLAASDPGTEITAWLSGARELFGLNDFTGSLELLLKVQQRRPEDPEVLQLIRSCEENLVQMYESKMGDRERRPRVAIQPDEVIWLSLDPRAGFVLAQIDGQVTFEDLYAICGLTRLDTARILNQLLEEGVIASDPPEHSGRRSSSGGLPKVRQ